ncbi:uncharacterized protein B0I36DRAFT_237392 [Microdochium trichocladiopsis]|uniref:Zn(2)-C6 fungal-type domain-containing protein n=1 Tax=Microdochium trichocladiopsis TaxID=1682393 RepID=A0A9P9BTY5_9PEZI|nr:uncharacterized protein B0I36DRAFT_237392 [Microdochium trichocladiopsis]KAH7037031.1 hypothetical protein B0I36DRAFT_237392 [Microdochium trichocladiopsis]
MRLGTKSCLECRRRKVRCIVAPGASRCRQCVLHRIKCKLSQAPLADTGPSPRDNNGSAGASSLDDSAQSSRLLASVLESLLSDESDKLLPPLQSYALVHSQSQAQSPSVASATARALSGSDGAFATAPLLHYLRDTLLTPAPSDHGGGSSPAVTDSPKQDLVRTRLRSSLVPERNTLQAVFELTQPFWSVWPVATHFPNTVAEACAFVSEELPGCDDGGAAKRLAWLSLCISQLPRDFVERRPATDFALPTADLASRLYEASRELAAAALEESGSLDALEALMVQYKWQLNLGRPRQGWKSIRLALDNALLLGLHRLDASDPANTRGRDIWTGLWRADRQMTLFLGVPHSVPEPFLNLPTVSTVPSQSGSPMDDIMDQAMLICGHIAERNHSPQQAATAYSQTAKITEEVDRLRAMIPAEWWLLTRGDTHGHALGQPFWQAAVIFFYHYINHLVHLPYVLPAKDDRRYQYSRDVALASAEGMLRAFRELPTCHGLPVACDWLDFATFSGAVVLVADLLSQQTRRLASEEERLWGVVADFARDMRAKSRVLDCIVPRQSADLLEHLHAVRHGMYAGPDEYDVVIPYFGRVSIRHPKQQRQLLHGQEQQLQQTLLRRELQQEEQKQQQPSPPQPQLVTQYHTPQQYPPQSHYSDGYSPASSNAAAVSTPIPTVPAVYQPANAYQTAVEFNWNLFRPQQSAGDGSCMELCNDWATQSFLPGPDDWNAVYEFVASEGMGANGNTRQGGF